MNAILSGLALYIAFGAFLVLRAVARGGILPMGREGIALGLGAVLTWPIFLVLEVSEYLAKRRRPKKRRRNVCMIVWSSQPDIQFLCDGAWSTPSWEEDDSLPPGIHLADDDDRLYTFESKKVNCRACRQKLSRKEGVS